MAVDNQLEDNDPGMGHRPKFQPRVRKKVDRQDIDKAMAIAVLERDKMAKEAEAVEREKASPANNDRFTSLLKSYYGGKRKGLNYKDLELVVAELRRMYKASEELGKWALSPHNRNLVRKDSSFLGNWKPEARPQPKHERTSDKDDLAVRDQPIPEVTFATVEEDKSQGDSVDEEIV